MDYNPPTGSTDPDAPYVGKTSSTQGSKVPRGAVEFPQRELVHLIEDAGLDPTNTDLTQVTQSINNKIAAAVSTLLADIAAATTIAPATTFYVRTDGSDSNDGSANANDAAHAFRTLTAASDYAMSRIALASGTVTFRLGIPGTYPVPQYLGRGTSTINILGNAGDQANYILTGTPGSGEAVVETFGTVNLTGLAVQNGSTGAHTLAASRGSVVLGTHVTLLSTGTTTGFHAYAPGGAITLADGCIIQGNAGGALWGDGGGQAVINPGSVLTISGNPTFSVATAYVSNSGLILVGAGASVSGSATGQRYLGQSYGIINTNGGGANFFPGSSAGAVTDSLYQ